MNEILKGLLIKRKLDSFSLTFSQEGNYVQTADPKTLMSKVKTSVC